MMLQTLFQNIFISRKPRVAVFADISKIVTMFFTTIFKDSKILKKIRDYEPKCNLYL